MATGWKSSRIARAAGVPSKTRRRKTGYVFMVENTVLRGRRKVVARKWYRKEYFIKEWYGIIQGHFDLLCRIANDSREIKLTGIVMLIIEVL
jgi:hypothetical protein